MTLVRFSNDPSRDLSVFAKSGITVLWHEPGFVIGSRESTGGAFVEVTLFEWIEGRDDGSWHMDYHATVSKGHLLLKQTEWGVNISGSGPFNSVERTKRNILVLQYALAEAEARNRREAEEADEADAAKMTDDDIFGDA